MSYLPDIKKYISDEIVSTFAEVHQPRSRFQLENFVVNAHPTPEMQYHQIITEIQALYYTIKQVTLELQKTEIEIKRLRETGDEVDEIDAQIKELGIEQTRVVGVGAFRELEVLLDLKSKYPEYTRSEIENGQLEYWQARLELQQMPANQQAIAQIQTKLGELE
jgi:hypothetical protein